LHLWVTVDELAHRDAAVAHCLRHRQLSDNTSVATCLGRSMLVGRAAQRAVERRLPALEVEQTSS